jgi:dephospho-CoA kinase
MLTVGLTGGIGSGKTSVSDLFKTLDVPIIDTDVISRDLVNHDRTVQQEIIDTLGAQVSTQAGSIDRKQLAQIVFNDKPAKQQLENILHPKIRAEVKLQLQQYRSQTPQPRYVIIVIPLLFETNAGELNSGGFSYRNLIDIILVITADEDVRIERISKRDDRSISEIRSIIANQISDKKRVSEADDILENNGDIAELSAQVLRLHQKYTGACALSE